MTGIPFKYVPEKLKTKHIFILLQFLSQRLMSQTEESSFILFMQAIAKSGGDELCFWIKVRIRMFSLYWTLDKPNSFQIGKQFLAVFESQLKMLQ